MRPTIKFSIVTASFNADKYIRRAIESVVSQSYTHFEFIIIDGQSNDNTVDIIREYGDKITYWVSEPDKGIYDAWNKGIAKATGDWIMFLGCDDILLPDALAKYADFISSSATEADYVSSKLQMVDAALNPVRTRGWEWEWPTFLNEMTVAHPGSLHSRKLFKTYGQYDTTYRIVGDYELLLRPKGTLKAAFMNAVTVLMSEGGASDSFSAIREHCRACLHTGGQSLLRAYSNLLLVASKFYTKKMLRQVGLNVYLKK
ncbi:glycosyltransferase family 2 protein [Tellurirhabdus rosea]|uniref:glycosyltransferase family 2 protein n=1 Tax=Tellurirhabdus rosea TaxID=2674997 RepID=UPI0022505860|nr:glycosyltransferase family 2 protein [Tellurirhabdus rosea]